MINLKEKVKRILRKKKERTMLNSINLSEMINSSLATTAEEKYIEKVVKDRIEGTIRHIIEDLFSSYSDFGKDLKDKIRKDLKVNFDKLGLEGYNGLVLTSVQEELDKAITINGVEKMKESISRILKEVKDEYTLTEIIEELKGMSTKESYEYSDDESIYLLIYLSSGGYTHIYIDEEEQDYKHCCKYQIDIAPDGIPYSIKIGNSEFNTNKVLGGLHGLDKLLFKVYSSGAKVILDKGTDPEDYDLYYEAD